MDGSARNRTGRPDQLGTPSGLGARQTRTFHDNPWRKPGAGAPTNGMGPGGGSPGGTGEASGARGAPGAGGSPDVEWLAATP